MNGDPRYGEGLLVDRKAVESKHTMPWPRNRFSTRRPDPFGVPNRYLAAQDVAKCVYSINSIWRALGMALARAYKPNR